VKLLLRQPDNGKVPFFLDYNLIFHNSCVCTTLFAFGFDVSIMDSKIVHPRVHVGAPRIMRGKGSM